MTHEKVWTRESVTEQILKDVAGLWTHIESQQSLPRNSEDLMSVVQHGCAALLNREICDTRDLLTLSVSMLHLIREVILEQQAKGRAVQ